MRGIDISRMPRNDTTRHTYRIFDTEQHEPPFLLSFILVDKLDFVFDCGNQETFWVEIECALSLLRFCHSLNVLLLTSDDSKLQNCIPNWLSRVLSTEKKAEEEFFNLFFVRFGFLNQIKMQFYR